MAEALGIVDGGEEGGGGDASDAGNGAQARNARIRMDWGRLKLGLQNIVRDLSRDVSRVRGAGDS
jgi:hypothetical protein